MRNEIYSRVVIDLHSIIELPLNGLNITRHASKHEVCVPTESVPSESDPNTFDYDPWRSGWLDDSKGSSNILLLGRLFYRKSN